ncbi:MAG: HlyD family efflux transporter periplasmic adaptor subunit [Gammaproteobacteria bacterium]|nr:HlyD family efflux transporter periplasmic adaptor subunit [Gammaproteobacteria bacterium]
MDTDLFRAEALASLRSNPWQPPLLSKPLSGALLTATASVSVGTLIAFAALFPFADKQKVSGYLAPSEGWIRVTAGSVSLIRRCVVAEDDLVAVGDVLFELASGDGFEAGQPLEAKLLSDLKERRVALQAQLDALDARFDNEQDLLDNTHAANENEIRELRVETRALATRLAIAVRQHDKGLQLVETGALAESDAMLLDDRVQSQRAALASKHQNLERAQSSLHALPLHRRRLESERQEHRAVILERLHALAMDESRLLADRDGRILAPRNGRIASIRARSGEWIRPGEPLLDILPTEVDFEARLFAGAAAMGTVAVGQEVRVYLDAFPYERHGAQTGLVTSVSETILNPIEMTAQGASNAAFRIDVAFPEGFDLYEDQRRTLRPGMTVTADLVNSRSTVIDWLIDPLRGAAARI